MPEFHPPPASGPPASPPGDPLTLPQLLELVEKAARGDQRLSQQLFNAFMQMRLQPRTPPNERTLADVLIRVLIGERSPSLSELDTDDVTPVSELIERLKN